MSLPRELAWQNLELSYKSSVAHQFARYALRTNYDSLPEDVKHEAKRAVLDALGCALGAYDAPARAIAEDVVRELGGREEATVFGSGFRTSAQNATLVNCIMVRYLDFNDIGGGGHNNDCVPSILAISERQSLGGRDFLTSVVLAYELGYRAATSSAEGLYAWAKHGVLNDCRGGMSMPPTLGKLMGLNEEQIANAIGICTSHALPMYILDAHREEMTMAKNLRFGWVTHDAIISCLLAKKGFTGPIRVVEGDNGFKENLLNGDMDLQKMTDFSGWHMLKNRYKVIPANATSIGHLMATLANVRENDIRSEDVAFAHIRVHPREVEHCCPPPKKYPRSGENADHSAHYETAIAILEGKLGAESFKKEKLTAPAVLDLVERITVEGDPDMPRRGGVSTITLKDGRVFAKRVDSAHGLADDPLTDQELEQKFMDMAELRMSREKARQLADAVWNVEKLDNMQQLAERMVFKH